jgi:hypothetical protein
MSPSAPEARSAVVTYRPRRLRLAAASFSASLSAASAFGWVLLPQSLRDTFSLSQRVTLLLILAGLIGAMVALASSSVRVDADGMRVRNGLRTHLVGWDQVHKILLRRGDPWAIALIKPEDRPFEVDLDAEKRQLMGIQASDSERSAAAVADLRRRHQEYRARQN